MTVKKILKKKTKLNKHHYKYKNRNINKMLWAHGGGDI